MCKDTAVMGNVILAYISPTILLAAYGLVSIFSKIKIKGIFLQRYVGIVSGCTFSVYLIHHNPYVWSYIINRNNLLQKILLQPFGVFFLLIYIFAIYFCCTLIEIIRKKIFRHLNTVKIERKVYLNIKMVYTKFLRRVM